MHITGFDVYEAIVLSLVTVAAVVVAYLGVRRLVTTVRDYFKRGGHRLHRTGDALARTATLGTAGSATVLAGLLGAAYVILKFTRLHLGVLRGIKYSDEVNTVPSALKFGALSAYDLSLGVIALTVLVTLIVIAGCVLSALFSDRRGKGLHGLLHDTVREVQEVEADAVRDIEEHLPHKD